MRLNLTQHGEPHQVRTQLGLTDCELFLDSVEGGAWPFLVRGLVCLVNSVNERELCLPIGLGLGSRVTTRSVSPMDLWLLVNRKARCFFKGPYVGLSLRKRESTAGL